MTPDPTKTHVVHEWKHGKPLLACRFDPTGEFLYTTSEDYTIQRWIMSDAKAEKKTAWPAHDSWIRDLAFFPDGKTLVTAGCDDRLIFWPVADAMPKPIREVVAHKGWIRAIDINKSGSLIVTGGNDRMVKLWSPDGKLVRELKAHERDVYSVLFHPDTKHVLSGDLDGKVHQWSITDGKLVRTFDAKALHSFNKGQRVHFGGVRGLAMNSDSTLLACCGLHKATNPLGAVHEPLIELFDWKAGEKVRSQPADGVKGAGWKVHFLSDGTEVCVSGGTSGGFLLFFKTAEEKPFHKFKLKNTTRDMSVHPDGVTVATAHHDGYVRVSRMAAKQT
jgi:WD40 repeat protein